MARSSPSYSPAAKQVARPSGHGVGRTRQPDRAAAAQQSAHNDRPGAGHPTQVVPCIRSSHASITPAQSRTDGPRRSGTDARLWTLRAAGRAVRIHGAQRAYAAAATLELVRGHWPLLLSV